MLAHPPELTGGRLHRSFGPDCVRCHKAHRKNRSDMLSTAYRHNNFDIHGHGRFYNYSHGDDLSGFFILDHADNEKFCRKCHVQKRTPSMNLTDELALFAKTNYWPWAAEPSIWAYTNK